MKLFRGATRRSFDVVAGHVAESAGALGAATWLADRGLTSTGYLRWHVEIALDTVAEPAVAQFDERTASRFHIDLYSEEWGFFFCHAGRASWIRVTDIPFVHGRDDYQLLSMCPAVRDLGDLLVMLEYRHSLAFRRDLALVRTNLANGEQAARAWLASL